MNRLQRYIIQSYPRFPLEDTGFKFAKCGRDKRIQAIESINSIADLENAIGPSVPSVSNINRRAQPVSGTSNRPSTSSRSNTSNSANFEISDDSDFEHFPTIPCTVQSGSRSRVIQLASRYTVAGVDEEQIVEDSEDDITTSMFIV